MKIDSANSVFPSANQLTSAKPSVVDKSENEQPNQLKSSVNQIDKVSLTYAATESAGVEPEDSRAYQGDERILIMPTSEKTDRMDAVISRLNTEQQKAIIDSNMLTEDSFLSLAETLSDGELGTLVDVMDRLQTLPKLNNFSTLDITGFTAAKGLVETLSSLEEGTRSRVLEQANVHAGKVASYDGEVTYLPNGALINDNSSSSANDLHNFVSAVNSSADVNTLLDDMAEFSDSQQSDLLHILGSNVEMGNRLMGMLSERDEGAQDAMLTMLSGLAQSTHAYNPDLAPLGSSGDVSAIIDHDNNSGRIVWQMIDDSITLMETYEFNDEQLEKMGGELTHLSRSDQRAYLSITTVGLEHLLGSEGDQPIDLAKHEAAVETIESLQSNASVRDVVFKSRMGEETISDGRSFYALKDEGESVRDQTAMVELLVTDTWMNQEMSAGGARVHTTQLANTLEQLGADQRDELVHQLDRLSQDEVPLAQRSLSGLQEDNQELTHRINVLLETESVETLLEVEETVAFEQKEDFWRVLDAAEEKVDPLLALLQQAGPDMREQIIAGLAQELSRVESEVVKAGEQGDADSRETGNDQGHQSVADLLSFFDQTYAIETDPREAQQGYLDRLLK